MTTADPMTELTTNGTPASAWHAQFAELRSRFSGTKDSILFCLHALQQDPGIQIDDLKAQATMHGFRVTAASVAAAEPNHEVPPARRRARDRRCLVTRLPMGG